MSRKRPAKHVVTIGTFNVFQWGMAGPEAIAAEIRAAKLDVVGLQEVSRGGWRCGVRGSRRRAQLRCGRRCGRLHGVTRACFHAPARRWHTQSVRMQG